MTYLTGTAAIDAARELATRAHEGQPDKSGRAYIEHPAQVVANLLEPDWGDIVVAWLHDVVEDTNVTLDEIRALFGPEIAADLDAVTHPPSEPNVVYYGRIRPRPRARKVKAADLQENTDPFRVAQLDPATRARLRVKYATAHRALDLPDHSTDLVAADRIAVRLGDIAERGDLVALVVQYGPQPTDVALVCVRAGSGSEHARGAVLSGDVTDAGHHDGRQVWSIDDTWQVTGPAPWPATDQGASSRPGTQHDQFVIVDYCASCVDYSDDPRLVNQGGQWLHVCNSSARCPGQGDDDTDDQAIWVRGPVQPAWL